jgi:hypothetical protein
MGGEAGERLAHQRDRVGSRDHEIATAALVAA